MLWKVIQGRVNWIRITKSSMNDNGGINILIHWIKNWFIKIFTKSKQEILNFYLCIKRLFFYSYLWFI